MEMAQSMLAAKHLPNEYWGEAVATVVYIMNRCSTKSVKNKVPQEGWIGMNHNVSHLKTFGRIAYAYVLYELRKKLENKGCNILNFGPNTYRHEPIDYDVILMFYFYILGRRP